MGNHTLPELEARRVRALLARLESATAADATAASCGVPGCVHEAAEASEPAIAA
jgi:hypothetical protein